MKNRIDEYNEFLSIFKNTNFVNSMDIEWVNENKEEFKTLHKEVTGFECPTTLRGIKSLPYIEDKSEMQIAKTVVKRGNCPRCGGTGKMPYQYADGICFKCDGSGNVK